MTEGFRAKMITSAFFCTLALLTPTALGQVNIDGPRALQMQPGETRTVNYTITNYGDEPAMARVFFNDYAQLPDGSLQHVPAGSLSQTLLRIAEFEGQEYFLLPQASVSLPLTITVPQDSLGGYWGVLGVENLPADDTASDTDVSFNIRYAMVTSLAVEGVVERQLQIDNIAAVSEEGGASTVVTIRNAGSSYERFDLLVTFEGADGTSETVEESFVVLPGMTIDRSVSPPRTLPPGSYGVFATVIYEDGLRADAVGTLTIGPER